MNIGLIGAGAVAPHHLRAIQQIPDAALKGITSRTLERANQLAEDFHIPVYPSWEDMLRDPDIDIVDIVTMPDSHAEISIAAARSGKHILLEKPMAATLHDADKILDAVGKHGVKLAINLQNRHSDAAREVLTAVRGGTLGKLIQGDAYIKWYRPASYYQPPGKGTWRMEGGGALIGQSIHTIDLLLWYMGHVESVFGYLHLGFSHSIESEDNAAAVLRFENGALGVIQGATSLYPGSPERIELHGEKGTITMEGGSIVRWDVEGDEHFAEPVLTPKKPSTGASDPMSIPVETFRRSVCDLMQAIQNDSEPVVTGMEARYTQLVVDALYRSGKERREILLQS